MQRDPDDELLERLRLMWASEGQLPGAPPPDTAVIALRQAVLDHFASQRRRKGRAGAGVITLAIVSTVGVAGGRAPHLQG